MTQYHLMTLNTYFSTSYVTITYSRIPICLRHHMPYWCIRKHIPNSVALNPGEKTQNLECQRNTLSGNLIISQVT